MVTDMPRSHHQNFTLIGVEEDGDEIFTPMPEKCEYWQCRFSKKDTKLVKEKGFMVCPVCRKSYGPA